MTRVAVTAREVVSVAGDVIVLPFAPDEDPCALACLRDGVAGVLNREPGHLTWLETRGAAAPWALAACVGPATSARTLGGQIERALDDRGLGRALVQGADSEVVTELVQGMLLRAYGFHEFVPDEQFSALSSVTVCAAAEVAASLRVRVRRARMVAESINAGRALADLPANVGSPDVVVQRFEAAAAGTGLRIEVLGATEISRIGMGLLAGLGAGSEHGPRLLVVRHGEGSSPVVLIGKGVLMDTGGYNLKREGLSDMSYDKAGGTAVLGAMLAADALRVSLPVVALVPLVENSVDARAMRPGDVLTAMDGTSVFIGNTDAEGRLALADAMVYARRFRPRAIIDIASLTHGSELALGRSFSALFDNDQDLRDAVRAAGARAEEEVWPMPISSEHRGMLRHGRAHLRNCAGDLGEPCVAAAFLEHFARGPWAHLDIGTKGYTAEDTPLAGQGATGYGTRLLVSLLVSLADSSTK